ncbi:MAG: glutaredoxin domain-containing protein [Tissierellia bacterium]|nr:glutaredoxin domain-containing protein [Tissierellia bacterium]MDD4726127.1 glutaredoxin domain-containing protein [Tissierellia bacterium]
MSENNVVVYSTTTCPWCVKVKDYLNSKDISFTEYNVQKDTEKAMEMIEKSGQRGVPVIDINDNIVIGFDKATIDDLLGL